MQTNRTSRSVDGVFAGPNVVPPQTTKDLGKSVMAETIVRGGKISDVLSGEVTAETLGLIGATSKPKKGKAGGGRKSRAKAGAGGQMGAGGRGGAQAAAQDGVEGKHRAEYGTGLFPAEERSYLANKIMQELREMQPHDPRTGRVTPHDIYLPNRVSEAPADPPGSRVYSCSMGRALEKFVGGFGDNDPYGVSRRPKPKKSEEERAAARALRSAVSDASGSMGRGGLQTTASVASGQDSNSRQASGAGRGGLLATNLAQGLAL